MAQPPRQPSATAVNDAPTSSGLAVSTQEDTAHSFGLGEFNFADVDGDDLDSLRIDTLPATGTLTLDGAAVTAGDVIPAAGIADLVYTPAANATGEVSFTFSLSDGTAFGTPATATVSVTAENDAPTSSGLAVTIDEDTAHSFTAGEFTFADADGDALHSLRIDTLPATGTLTLDGAVVTEGDVIPAAGIGTLVYTPAANATGDVSFTFSLSDGTAFGTPATATVSVTAENDAPTSSGLAVTIDEDTAHSFTAGEFTFADADGDALHSLRIDTLPATGTLTLDGATVIAGDVIPAAGIANLVYTPAANATGDVNFTFSLSDGTAFGATATATVSVTAVNDAPTSSGLAVSTEEDTAHSFTAGEFNFADVDGDDLDSLRIDTLPGSGSLTLDGAAVTAGDVIPAAGIANLVYTPAANATGDVSFTFSLSDGTAFGATATATVSVTAENDAPTSSGLAVSTDEDTAHSFAAGEFNFADVDGDDLDSLRIDTLPVAAA